MKFVIGTVATLAGVLFVVFDGLRESGATAEARRLSDEEQTAAP